MRILTTFDDLDPVPWANGAGETTELVSLTDSEALTPSLRPWRLSIARLERPGHFSRLPEMTRTFLPTAEVALRVGTNVHQVRPQSPLQFHGSQETVLLDLATPCFAINLMVADGDRREEPRPGQEMTVRHFLGEAESADARPEQDEGPCFGLKLEATSTHPRFRLLEFDRSDSLPSDLAAVVLRR